MTPRTPKLFGFQTGSAAALFGSQSRVRHRGPPQGHPSELSSRVIPNEVKNEFTQSCHSERSEESALLSLFKPCHPERNGVFAQSARTPRSRRTPTLPVPPRSFQGVLPSVPDACERPEDWEWSSFRQYAIGCEGQVEIECEWTARKRERATGTLCPAVERPTQAKVGLEGRTDERPATRDRWLAASDKNASPRLPSDAIMLATCASQVILDWGENYGLDCSCFRRSLPRLRNQFVRQRTAVISIDPSGNPRPRCWEQRRTRGS